MQFCYLDRSIKVFKLKDRKLETDQETMFRNKMTEQSDCGVLGYMLGFSGSMIDNGQYPKPKRLGPLTILENPIAPDFESDDKDHLYVKCPYFEETRRRYQYNLSDE